MTLLPKEWFNKVCYTVNASYFQLAKSGWGFSDKKWLVDNHFDIQVDYYIGFLALKSTCCRTYPMGRFHQNMRAAFRPTFLPDFFVEFLSDYFCQTLLLAKFDAFCGEWRLANGAQIWQISTYIVGINIVDEIEWRFFRRLLCAGEFLLGAQSLVKLTPEVHRLIIQSRFGNPPNNQFN